MGHGTDGAPSGDRELPAPFYGSVSYLPLPLTGKWHGNYVGPDWTGGKVTNNSAFLKMEREGTLPRPTDAWDRAGFEHDRALAHATSAGDFLRADATYAKDTLVGGAFGLNPMEMVSGALVGSAGLIAHQLW